MSESLEDIMEHVSTMEEQSLVKTHQQQDLSKEAATNVSFSTHHLLYRFFPTGSSCLRLTFQEENNVTSLDLTRKMGVCGCATQQNLMVSSMKVRRQPLVSNEFYASLGRILRDAVFGFVYAFLFHLVPSVIWSPEQSLGSPTNHQLMGVVWFGGWPIWFCILWMGLRPWGIQVVPVNANHDTEKEQKIFIPFSSWKQAMATMTWWNAQLRTNNEIIGDNNQQEQEASPPVPTPSQYPLLKNAWFVSGWIFLIFLIVNMIVTGVLVMQCMDRGCCKDDKDTLDCCVETGYPDC